jgi:hypothetical protein
MAGAAAHRRAVDGRDHRRDDLREGEVQMHRQLGARLGGLRVGEPFELGEVRAGAESRCGAGEDDGAHAFVLVGGAQCLEQRLGERRIERVALFRTVERQDAHRALVFHE